MKIIVGLGNPGKKYDKTRHNAGFMVLDEIIKKQVARIKNKELNNNLEFKFNKKFNAEMCEYSKEIFFVKPQTYMNNSGVSVNLLASYFKLLNSDLIIIHDDMDLELGRIKIQFGGGSGGHHGIESIVSHIGSPDFIRVRLGVGRSKSAGVNDANIDFLLSRFRDDEVKLLQTEINKCVEVVLYILENGIEKAMNKYNSKISDTVTQ